MIVNEVVTILIGDDVFLQSEDVPREDTASLRVGITPDISFSTGDSLTINGRRFTRTRADRKTPHLWYDAVTFACVEINTSDDRWAWVLGAMTA